MILKKVLNIFLLISTLVLGSGVFLYYTYKGNKKLPKVEKQKTEHFYRGLSNLRDFKEIQGAPLSNKFNDVLSVKLVYDTESDVLYYVKSELYKYHFDFCSKVLHYNEPLEVFNILNYGKTFGRRFYLANLNYYAQSHHYTLEFTSDDAINEHQILTLYNELIKTSYLKDSLKLLMSSEHLAEMDRQNKVHIPRIYPSEIYKGQQYQMLEAGKTFGVLKRPDDLQKELSSITEGDILITKGTPITVPVCAGIVTNTFQTPLSHINILCHNRKIPSAVSLSIWERKDINALIGKPVCMIVSKDSVQIFSATMAELDSFRKNVPVPKRITLKGKISVDYLLPVADFGLAQQDIVGNKAAGLGELQKVAKKRTSDFIIPEGAFAIPFYFYKQHVHHPEIKALMDKIIKEDTKDIGLLKNQLKRLRQLIKAAPLDPALLQKVTAMIQMNHAGDSYRFRSSSNAEDREGFSGAGLYESKTGVLNDASKPIEKAIKAVWASVWNDEAFLERRAYNVDQNTVLMAILAHRNFPEEQCNGVAITRNIYRPDFPGMTINVQIGEVEVVAPPDSVICEQFVCVPVSATKMFSDDIAVDYITSSNITKGQKVLSKAQIEILYNSLEKIKYHFYNKMKFTDNIPFVSFGLDLEFKFDKNNKLYIKQVRPYF